MIAGARVAVFGASGFVGRATVDALRRRGAEVTSLRAPRLQLTSIEQLPVDLAGYDELVNEIARELTGMSAVVNAAGNPDASSRDALRLGEANALLPALLAKAVQVAGVPRFVHVSSAVVQGSAPMLDDSPSTMVFSAYSRSKALGESLAQEFAPLAAVIYRPPSVHAADRRVSRMTARIARSRLSSVARPGSSPTPQALLANVADALAFLATTSSHPPAIVAYPSEGLTTAGLLEFLGGHRPRELPRGLARAVVGALKMGGRVLAPLAANARRVEMVWFGQLQGPSWLTEVGWRPPQGLDAWGELGRLLADSSSELMKRTESEEDSDDAN